jgi:hypothetical protein
MSILTQEELAIVKAANAALGAKLETATFIPKERFDEVNTRSKELADQLAKFEADKKQSEDAAALAQGKYKEIAERTAKELADTRTLLETEKKTADEMRAFRKAKTEQIQKDLGDKWQPEYEGLSVASLEKLRETILQTPKANPDGSQPGVRHEAKSLRDMAPAEREKMISDAMAGKLVKP